MAPTLTAPPPCQEPEESPEPPPWTLFHASQSPQLCRQPQPPQPSSRACAHTPAARCIAKTSRFVRASSAFPVSRSVAGGVRTAVRRAAKVRAERRRIALRRMRMDVIVISGCSTISVLRMLLRKVTGGSLEGRTRVKEGLVTRYSAILIGKERRRFEIAQETYRFDKFDHLCTQFASTPFLFTNQTSPYDFKSM